MGFNGRSAVHKPDNGVIAALFKVNERHARFRYASVSDFVLFEFRHGKTDFFTLGKTFDSERGFEREHFGRYFVFINGHCRHEHILCRGVGEHRSADVHYFAFACVNRSGFVLFNRELAVRNVGGNDRRFRSFFKNLFSEVLCAFFERSELCRFDYYRAVESNRYVIIFGRVGNGIIVFVIFSRRLRSHFFTISKVRRSVGFVLFV